MNEPNKLANVHDEAPNKKHSLGAKIGVALAFGGCVGTYLGIPGLLLDINTLFPKGTSLGTKFKKTFSRDIIALSEKAITHEVEVMGRGPLMASIVATKWSTVLTTIGGIALAVVGWQRADRIHDCKDIITQPIKSTKIIFGLQEPDQEKLLAVKGKYTGALLDKRSKQVELQTQR